MDDSYNKKPTDLDDIEEKKIREPKDDAFERLEQASSRDDAAVKINDNSLKRLKNDIKYINDIRVNDKEKIVSECVSLHNVFNFIQKDIDYLKDEIKDYNKDVSEIKNLFNFLLKKEKRIDKFIGLFKKDIFWAKYVTNLFVIYCENIVREREFSMAEPFRFICDKETLTKLTKNSPRKAKGVLITMGLSRFKKYHFLKDLFTGSVFIMLLKEKDFFKEKIKDVNRYIDEKTGFFKIDSNPMEGLNKFRKEIIDLLRSIKEENPPSDAIDKKNKEEGDTTSNESLGVNMKNFNINKNVFGRESTVIDLTSPSIMASESFTTIAQSATHLDKETKTIVQPIFFMNEISRNNSYYDGESVLKAIKNPYVEEKLRAGVLQGEREHPDPKLGLERFMKVDPDNVSHVIKKMDVKNGNMIEGTMTFIPPKGGDIWEWILAGANMAFSIRIYTPNFKVVKKSDGKEYTEKFGEMQFVTFDCVRMPGFYYARMTNPDQYDNRDISQEDVKRFNSDLNKSIESDKVRYEMTVTDSEIVEILMGQESFGSFRDRFGIDFNNSKVEYMENGMINIMTSPTRRVSIQTDAYKVNSILSRKMNF